MLTAITRRPSPELERCQLTFLPRQKIDFKRACRQHRAYRGALAAAGADVRVLEENPSLPDSVFVEDTAVVLDEVAVVTQPSAPARRPEVELVENDLAGLRPLQKISPPARLEGGDVLRIGKKIYVGLSKRTDGRGAAALAEIVRPFGYRVYPVGIRGCLHLKTAVTALDTDTLLVNPDWIQDFPADGGRYKMIGVAAGEPFAANVLRVNQTLFIHSGFRRTIEKLGRSGFRAELLDISEFLKAEAGLTCLSLIFSRSAEKPAAA